MPLSKKVNKGFVSKDHSASHSLEEAYAHHGLSSDEQCPRRYIAVIFIKNLMKFSNIALLLSREEHKRFHKMRPDHFPHVFLIIIESHWAMLVQDPQRLETVDEGLVRVGVDGRAGPLRPNQAGQVRDSFQLDDLVGHIWHYGQSVEDKGWTHSL